MIKQDNGKDINEERQDVYCEVIYDLSQSTIPSMRIPYHGYLTAFQPAP